MWRDRICVNETFVIDSMNVLRFFFFNSDSIARFFLSSGGEKADGGKEKTQHSTPNYGRHYSVIAEYV